MLVRLVSCALLILVACGDNTKNTGTIDAQPIDSSIDSPDIDAPPNVPDGIAPARAADDGTGLNLAIVAVTVTYIKPQIGSTTNDPAGFTIQHDQLGPALFIAVDPATLTPTPAVGDVVSFKINALLTIGGQKRATAIADYTRHAQNANVGALAQDISAAADLVTAIDSYESEIVTITASLGVISASGQGFVKSLITTTGIPAGDANLQFRVPQTLVDAIDMVQTCNVTATLVPVGRFNAQAQIGAFSASDFTLTNCPAPTVVSAVALSSTSVRVTFSRNILASSVSADGSQFTFNNGLVASAAAVSGRSVTVTTGAQAVGTNFTVTVANTVTDLQATGVGTPSTGTFGGFVVAAVLRINELNANITGGCDLIELRVIEAGSIGGIKLNARGGDMSFTFPGVTVAKNDFIIVHTNSTNATCNPGGATQELTAPNEQPQATFGKNFDTAYDFWSTDDGLTASSNVFTIVSPTDAIVDALFAQDLTSTIAGATLTSANAVGAATQWQPAQATYDAAQFTAASADDLNATGTVITGNSMQRLDNTDDDDKADWTAGSGAAPTFGALNPGQTAL
jgi:hypothetical protein